MKNHEILSTHAKLMPFFLQENSSIWRKNKTHPQLKSRKSYFYLPSGLCWMPLRSLFLQILFKILKAPNNWSKEILPMGSFSNPHRFFFSNWVWRMIKPGQVGRLHKRSLPMFECELGDNENALSHPNHKNHVANKVLKILQTKLM